MKKFTKQYYDHILSHYKLNRSDMPLCDSCKTNQYVVIIGPDSFGFEFRCTKCRYQWAQFI